MLIVKIISLFSVNITVPRLGGAFGGKSWDASHFAAAATLGAYISDR